MSLGTLWLGSLESFQVAADAEIKRAKMTIQDLADMAQEGIQAFGFGDEKEDQHPFGEMRYMADVVEGVAVISISGPLVPGADRWNKYMGVVGYGEIREAVGMAAQMDDVKSILLDIDSPGGAVNGISEISSFLRRVDADYKPVYSSTGTVMASGGYWLGSVGRQLYASELATVGSIGVVAVHREYTKMLKEAGITATVIRKGKYKALGNPYETLSPEAEAKIEKELSSVYDVFTRTVAENRGLTQQFVMDNSAEGQTFFGREAKEKKLVDIIGTFDDALEQMINGTVSTSTVSDSGVGIETMAKRRALTAAAQAAIAAGAEESKVLASIAAEDEPTPPEGEAGEGEGAGEGTEATAGEGAGEGEGAQAGAGEGAGDESGAQAGDGAGEGEGGAAPASAASEQAAAAQAGNDPALERLVSRLNAAEDKVVDLRVELREVQAKTEMLKAANTGLREVTASAIGRLQVALGSSAIDVTDLDDTALLSQYNTLNAEFLKRYPVGASTKVPHEDADKANEVTTQQTHESQATRFKKRED